ncbi:MAG: TSUP family transporter, partial [Candidatus Angelobacter sp.]
CPGISAGEVVGTDLGLGLVLAGLGSSFHFTAGTVSSAALKPLLLGAAPGVLLGCYLSRKIPSRHLQRIMLLAIVLLGLQMLWTGARDFADHGKNQVYRTLGCQKAPLLPAARRGVRRQYEPNSFDPPQASGVSFRSIQVHQFSINPLSPNMAMAMCTCCCMCPGGRPVMRNLS